MATRLSSALAGVFGIVTASLSACAQTTKPVLALATTTSVANSGLLDVLVHEFHRQHGTLVRPYLVGSGRALAMLAAGQVDVVISHAPAAEARAIEQHRQWFYAKVMFNDFLIVGPAIDPADVKTARSPEEAFRRIARADTRFVSRGDESGTHEREQLLWGLAGISPERARVKVAGQGMGATLRIADQVNAYTLVDRATYTQLEGSVSLVPLFQGGPQLLNTYSVIRSDTSPEADTFVRWLTGGGGREAIENYRVRGVPVFTPWPRDRG